MSKPTEATPVARNIDRITVVEAYPGCWAVDADGIRVPADSAAEAVALVHRALLGDRP